LHLLAKEKHVFEPTNILACLCIVVPGILYNVKALVVLLNWWTPLRQECRGRPALCRGSGFPRKTFFLLFCSSPAAAREKKEVSGDTPDPGRENPAPLQGINQLRGGLPRLSAETTIDIDGNTCYI